MDYILTSDRLKKCYKDKAVLSDFSIHIPKGSVYGLVGKNGAGKTTFIRIVCGLISPTDGGFTLYGTENTDKKIYDARKRTGAIIETPALFNYMTVEDNLKYQCRLLGLPDFDCIDGLLELTGLTDAKKKKAGHLSLGMRQRLSIAIALCGSPDFLILDEPMNGLDPYGIVEVRELILRLNREKGVTVLISSHILDELSKVATHYGFLDGGRLVREVSAEELNEKSRKCLRITLKSTKDLPVFLDNKGTDYKIISGTEADIYEISDISAFILELANAGFTVSGMRENDENLESFYINLLGGENNG